MPRMVWLLSRHAAVFDAACAGPWDYQVRCAVVLLQVEAAVCVREAALCYHARCLPLSLCMQVCTEFLGQELPYFPASSSSMFWDQGQFRWSNVVQHCRDAWGVEPSEHWSVIEYGGLDWRCGCLCVCGPGESCTRMLPCC